MIREILTLRNTLFGLAAWAVPFLAAFGFFDAAGALTIDATFFKTIMIVVGGLSGAWLLVLAFRRVRPSFLSGLALGLFWLAINWALDLGVLVVLMGTDPVEWFTGIGLRYLMIPIMAAAMGAVGARAGG